MTPSNPLDLLHVRPPTEKYTEAEMDAAASVYCSINGLLRLATRILEDGARFGWVDAEGEARTGYSGKGEVTPDGLSGGIHVYLTQPHYPMVPDRALVAEYLLSRIDDPGTVGFLAGLLERIPTASWIKAIGNWDMKADLFAFMAQRDPDSGLRDVAGEASCKIRLTPPGAKSPLQDEEETE